MRTADTAPLARTVHRVEVRPALTAGDPAGDRLVREAAALGYPLASARTARVYLVEAAASRVELDRAVTGLLADPVSELAEVGTLPPAADAVVVEVHPLPGVTDPAAGTVRDALRDLFGVDADVQTGRRYDLMGVDAAQAAALARRLLANPVVHGIHAEPYHPAELPRGAARPLEIVRVPVRELDDPGLERLSREGHLFLDLEEMRAIREEFRRLGREPTDIELETLAQTWSEHCVHKTLKSRVRYTESPGAAPIEWEGRPGVTVHKDGSVTIDNLLRSTVAAATHELIADGVDWCVSVFVDNAGIVRFDEEHAVCVKVETHNRPSAIEPYGGAATGIGGCIRDIIGTGLAARPIASTDVFCVAPPGLERVPEGCLPPERILTEVVAGVRDYGNRMGIPTVNGAVWFDERHVGNPLVFCGCVGVLPMDRTRGEPRAGDRIVALGGRTGRDGIHGATFSSAGLTDTHADEFSHAVQIGNAIEEKRVLDAILRAREAAIGGERTCLYSAITDCGAGGFSSAIGEMGEMLGAEVNLERAPLKYAGLSYTEIWISEAQERMILAVPEEHLAALQEICDREHVELADLGHFGTSNRELVLRYDGMEVGRLPMGFVHDGLPQPTREATWTPEARTLVEPASRPSLREALLKLLASPNIASKHWIIRQYDHEVQGATVIKPLGGPLQRGPMDAAVVQPVPGSSRGLAIGCGLATGLEDDPYVMAMAAVDECVRNLVCVGADPERIAILDNFCWPSCAKPANLGGLVRAAVGCYDAAKAYRTPFVSGKDSLNNQFRTKDGTVIEIPPTLLITGIGIVEDVHACVTMDAKRAGNRLVLLGDARENGPRTARAVAGLIRDGLARAAHDVSDGGLLCAVAEMLIGGSTPDAPLGAAIERPADPFGEEGGRYVLEVDAADLPAVRAAAGGTTLAEIGVLDRSGVLTIGRDAVTVEELAGAWLGTLDW